MSSPWNQGTIHSRIPRSKTSTNSAPASGVRTSASTDLIPPARRRQTDSHDNHDGHSYQETSARTGTTPASLSASSAWSSANSFPHARSFPRASPVANLSTSPTAQKELPIRHRPNVKHSLNDQNQRRRDEIPRPTARTNDYQGQHNRSENPHPNGGFLHNASNVLFSGPVTMVDNTVESLESNRVVIQRLGEKGMTAAIHNSSSRAYPPRCHEETRQSIRTDIVGWSADPHRRRRMRWYLGPAGVGKSAIAQSVAEELAKAGRLGATFFFSRPGKVDDPNAVVPTLAYQLAMQNPRYKRLITERLGDDPLILDMDRATQFRVLILEPFQIVALEDEASVRKPLLIIVDGLDECKDKAAQCELIHLINSDVARTDVFPLLWMVCSRPEWHLKNILADVNSIIYCQQEEISVDDGEAQADARRLLRIGLDEIRQRNYLPPSWPPKEQVDLITRAAAGHLGFISFLVRFIKGITDDDDNDPYEQFRLCVKVVSGPGIDPEAANPLEALDRLYHQILSKVPSDVLPTTMRIIGLSILYSGYELTAHDQAKFLDIPQATFQRSLKQLHSVIHIPTPAEAERVPLHLYHASFSDFLRDSARSHSFCLDEGAVHLDVAIQSLSWLGRGQLDRLPGLARESREGTHFSAKVVWKACSRVPKEFAPHLASVLNEFDFRGLQPAQIDRNTFGGFIYWLYTQGPQCRPLISLVDGHQETAAPSLDFEYLPPSPVEYCAAFLSGIRPGQPPVTLDLVLGHATQIQVRIFVCDNEAQAGARRILRKGIDEIRQQNHLPPSWPPKEQLDLIVRAASGRQGFVSFLIRFIQGPAGGGDSDPCEQFRLCVEAVSGPRIDSETENPLEALDRLYNLVLSQVPPGILPTTMRIIGLSILYSGHELTVHDQARFLDIPEATFQRSLKQLHSVIYIQNPTEAKRALLSVYHGSFVDFLRDSSRSRDFCLDEGAVHLDVAIQSLSWLEREKSEKPPGITKTMQGNMHFSANVVWTACCAVPEKCVPALSNVLGGVDFGSLQLDEEAHSLAFVEFIRWLYIRDPGRLLISLVKKSRGDIPTVAVRHGAQDPTEYCAAFSVEARRHQLPVVLKFVLGKATQMNVHVMVMSHTMAQKCRTI